MSEREAEDSVLKRKRRVVRRRRPIIIVPHKIKPAHPNIPDKVLPFRRAA